VWNNTYIKKTVINLESAKPAVYQPSDRLDGMEVDKGVVCSLPIMAWSKVATLSLLLYQTNNKWLYKKRDKRMMMIYSYVHKDREPSSHELNVSPVIQIYNMYTAWQPNLVLGILGRARKVPTAFSGSNLGFRHSSPN